MQSRYSRIKKMEPDWLCKKCGTCCRILKLPAKNKQELIKLFKTYFGFSLKSYDIEVLFRGECEHLKNNQCKIYKERPELCKNYICKRFTKTKYPNGTQYQKRCRVCQNLRIFQAGTERDKQSVCGNCWVW